jgi:hypothetical protein
LDVLKAPSHLRSEIVGRRIPQEFGGLGRRRAHLLQALLTLRELSRRRTRPRWFCGDAESTHGECGEQAQ